MNRRLMLRTLGTGAAVAVLAPSTLILTGCGAQNLSFYVDTITGSLKALQPLLPGASSLLGKAITIAGDLNAAYKKGDFASTSALFASLSDNLNQIANDAGILQSQQAKIILAVAGVALMTIANLLNAQASPQAGAVKAAKKTATADQLRGAAMIEKASDPAAVEGVFRALKMQ